MAIRLQKIIAQAGMASRREAERMIEAGQVTVNGQTIRELGSTADPFEDKIKVKGRLIPAPQDKIYLVFNKPKGCLTTVKDDRGRETVMKYFKHLPLRVFPVGRLDYNTDGVLLFTNDGEWSKRVLAPESQIPRTYLVRVHGIPNDKALNRLRRGVRLDGVATAPIKTEIHRTTGKNAVLLMTLVEGKNRHIRRVCEIVGHPVVKLTRTEFGGVGLKGLPEGAFRPLNTRERKGLLVLPPSKRNPKKPKSSRRVANG